MSEFIPNGALIGRYRILAPIGQGGMATVYKVTDTVLERDVALKLIRIDQFPPAILETVLKRFEREAKALARLDHPNIVRIHDYGDHENAPYLVMDFLPGQSFKQIRKPVPYKLAIHLIRPIADALAYAHAQGIFHRDVKPGNIMLTRTGKPVLTDFGIAKLLNTSEEHTLTSSGIGIGTPEYMAPEQGLGREIDERADQYSLAIVLYELITNHKPFCADTPMEVVLKQHTEALPPICEFAPDVPVAVEKVILRALTKSPDQRFPDMTSFARALEDTLLPGNSQLTVTPLSQSDTTVFDSQPRTDSDTVAVMPFNTGANSKVKSQAPTPPKKKPQLVTWLVPLALLIITGAIFFLRHPADNPVMIPTNIRESIKTITVSTKTVIPQATKTSAPAPTNTPVSPILQTKQAFISYQTQSAEQGQTATAEKKNAAELIALDSTMKAFYRTETAALWTTTPTISPTPTLPVEVKTVSEFLEKKQYARLGAYIREIANPSLKEQLEQFVANELFDGEMRLIRYRECSGKYGYINTLGEIIAEAQFDEGGVFSNGLARVKKNNRWNYIDGYGKIVIKDQYWGGDFSEGLAIVAKNGKFGYMNVLGEIVIEPQFENAGSFSNGFGRILKNGKWGFINSQGEIVVKPQFDNIKPFSEGLAPVSTNKKWGYINEHGEVVIDFQFDSAGTFSDGLAPVKINQKICYINMQGVVILKPEADYALYTFGRLPLGWRNKVYGYINTFDEVVFEPQFYDAWAFSEGLARIKKNGKFGFINTRGESVIEPLFDDVLFFSDNLAVFWENYKRGYINKRGEIIIEAQFDDAWSFSYGLALVKQNGATFFIDPTGETVFVACKR